MKPLSTALADTLITLNAPIQATTESATPNTLLHGSTGPDGKGNGLPSVPQANPEVVRNLPMISSEMRGLKLLESILSNHKLDWHGYRDRNPAATWAGEPVPVLRIGSEAHREAVRLEHEIEASNAPIHPERLATLLYTLHGHYWQQDKPASLLKEVVKDYIQLLAHYPQDVFEKVKAEILLEPERRFVPVLGELNALLEKRKAEKDGKLQRLQVLLSKAATA